MSSAGDDAEMLATLRAEGLTAADVLRLARTKASPPLSLPPLPPPVSLWAVLLPYAVSLAAGYLMYHLTSEEEPEAFASSPTANTEDHNSSPSQETSPSSPDQSPPDTTTLPLEESVNDLRNRVKEKNQMNEVLRALADLKQEISSLTSHVKEAISPPIIKDFDVFAPNKNNSNNHSAGIETDSSVEGSLNTTANSSLSDRLAFLNQSLSHLSSANNDHKDKLSAGSSAAIMYFSKLKTLPLQTRYKRIYRNNSTFLSSLGALQGHEDLLTAIGFTFREAGGYYEWTWSIAPSEGAVCAGIPSPEETRLILDQCLASLLRLSKGEAFVDIDTTVTPPADALISDSASSSLA